MCLSGKGTTCGWEGNGGGRNFNPGMRDARIAGVEN